MNAALLTLLIGLPPQAPMPPQAPALKESPEAVFLRRIESVRSDAPAVVFRNCPDRQHLEVRRYYDSDGSRAAIYFVPPEGQGQIREMPSTVSDDVILGRPERKAVAAVATPFRGFVQQRAVNCAGGG